MLASVWPYLQEVRAKKVRPRLAAWETLSLLTAVAGIASLTDGRFAAAVLMFVMTCSSLSVVWFGRKHGDRRLETYDLVSRAIVILGIVPWFIFSAPSITVLIALLLDFVNTLPSVLHTWEKPHGQAWRVYFLAALAGAFTILAASSWRPTAIAYPIYTVLINFVLASIILLRQNHVITKKEPFEIREL